MLLYSFVLFITTSLVIAVPYPFNSGVDISISSDLDVKKLIEELGPQLSPSTSVFGCDNNDCGANVSTLQWNAYATSRFNAVIEVGEERDVASVVRYANAYGIPFLLGNRGHGSTKTLGTLNRGIKISLKKLDRIEIQSSGKSAKFQGGVETETFVNTLWEAGKVGASGSCDCVGTMGAGLGGGHGLYEGFYGLVSDNIISMNVILADGEDITVSETEHPDLYWGMRGAGHNFGIVTNFEANIYDRTVETWFYVTYFFTHDTSEDLFTEMNRISKNGTGPKELTSWAVYAWVPPVSPHEPIIVYNLYYAGSAEDAAPYIAPFEQMPYLYRVSEELPYPQIRTATGLGNSSPICQMGLNRMLFPLGLLEYNITTNREVWDLYRKITTEEPLFRGSTVLFESYAQGGVKAVPSDSSAYPWREDNILVAVSVTYEPNSSLDLAAIGWGRETVDIFHAGDIPGRQRHTYVNYAAGDEPVEEIYGYEPWRLERLRALKEQYDPHGRFNLYNPFVA